MDEDTNPKDSFLTDENDLEDGVDYIQPNVELKLPAKRRNECREIVREIKKFGVSQRQILYLIYLLSLELENVEVMRELAKTVGYSREKIQVDEGDLLGKNIIIPE
jgi:tRNA(Glu) U13 pseudouridine synthase TruD